MKRVFSVYDSKAGYYLPRFEENSAGAAIRQFTDICNDASPQNIIGRHPADFTLFEVATRDEFDGKSVDHEAFINLGNGIDYLNRGPAPIRSFEEQVAIDQVDGVAETPENVIQKIERELS